MSLFGIDLGGTKIEGIVLDSREDPKVLFRNRIPTEAGLGYDHVLKRISELVEIMKEKTGMAPTILGIGTPGSVDPKTGFLKNCNSTYLNGMPFREDIEKVLEIPVRIANDANCLALAETRMGAVKATVPKAKVVFGLILGTGVGGGIVIDGEVLNGHQGISGEWGHNFLDASGGKCYCGKEGCVETIISGPALEEYYTNQSGIDLGLIDILKRSGTEQDKLADLMTVARLVHFFGLGLSNVINILDPDVIVVGGGVGNIDQLYTLGVKEVEKYVFNPSFDTPIIKPLLGDSAGVFGAALLVA